MKVALVPGAARGIGIATTKQFLAKGWRVAMVEWDGNELALKKHKITVAKKLFSVYNIA